MWCRYSIYIDPSGTRLHQITRKGIQSRQPALLNNIKKYNESCKRIETLAGTPPIVPIPPPLPLQIQELREDKDLNIDVWFADDDNAKPPLWVTSSVVRKAIRNQLHLERTSEEAERLGREVNNLIRWYTLELAAYKVAMHSGTLCTCST